jgi:hypothetical protein
MVLGTNQITTGGTLPIDCTNQSKEPGTTKLTTPDYKLSGQLIYGSICKTGFLSGLPRHRYLEITGSDEDAFNHFKDHFPSYTLDEIQVFLEPVGLELVLVKKCTLPADANLPQKYISFCEKIGGGTMTGGELLEYFTQKGMEIQLRSRSAC